MVAIRADGSKAPLVSWRSYQRRRADRARVAAWFAGNPPGIGVVCGAVSGGLEMLELEGRAIEEGLDSRLVELVRAAGLGQLWRRVAVEGYVERTPSGGLHLLYRVADVPVGRNAKLARRPATEAELADDPSDKIKTLAETRGEGGYTVVAPSHGAVHQTGRAWVALRGATPARIPTITGQERDALVAVVRCLDAMPPPPVEPPRSPRRDGSAGTAPGEDYERRTDWADILEPAGWRLVSAVGRTRYWRRPGKRTGVSATTGRADDRDRLYVFTTSSEFESETPITKFHAYAVLHHRGDHAAAAAALRRAGFGVAVTVASAPETHCAPGDGGSAAGADADGLPAGGPAAASAQVGGEPLPHVAGWGPTEDGLARALVTHHGHELRYCPQRGMWLRWTGYRWLWDEAEYHRELIRRLARQLPTAGRWRRFKARALSAAGVAGIARLAQSDPAVMVHVADLDAEPYALNTPDGVVDLRTGELHPPRPQRLHTRCTPVGPDFERRSAVWDGFLRDIFGDDREVAGYVQRLLGVSAVGAVSEQVLPFAFGPGSNGKSTLLEAAMHALGRGEGGYAIAAPAEMLMVRTHAEHPAELAQLTGARLVVCAELEDGARFAESRIKQLTGRDSINARFMRGNPFTFAPSHTLWLLGNHKPVAKTGGPAFWRRVRLIPFGHTIPPERQEQRIGERLAEDAAAVLAWIVRGAVAYHADGLREPAIVTSATQEYARDEDTVGRFIDDQCHLAAGQELVQVGTTVLREAYERWCDEVGETPVSAKRLTQELRDRFRVGDARGAKGRRIYTGICLLAADSEGGFDEAGER
ncbi:hypothetical protein HC030_11455 [Planosporangium mesophilum]|nr:hypothetical protein [Planosporangium mesophilum]